MAERSHAEVEELLGAFALDALEPDEAQDVERHLLTCPRCRAEVIELREVAALWANSGADAPEGVWDRIVDALDAAPPPMRLEVVSLDRRRRRVRRAVAGALAAAAVLVVAVLGLQVRHQNDRVGKVEVAQGLDSAVARAVSDPQSRTTNLVDKDGKKVAFVVVSKDGTGYLVADSSAMPPIENRIYQLWGATQSGQVVSLGVMDQAGIYGFPANQSFTTVMVTVEERPVDASHNSAIASGNLA